MADTVTLTISRDEAIVLHEWLARVVDDENAKAFFFHGANPSASLAGRLAGAARASK